MINLQKKIKVEGGSNDNIYRRIYPKGPSAPTFYWVPIMHKKDIPLRPIVLSRGTVTYGVANKLARILKPLVGKTSNHIKNTKDFID